VRREVLAADTAGPGGDLHDEVVGALKLGRDPQNGQQETQV
jgi:hypothetical protein